MRPTTTNDTDPTHDTRTAPIPSDRTLSRLQAGSGLVFAIFLLLHLATALTSIGGPPIYESALGWVRLYYRLPLVEVGAVLGAALTHLVVGLVRVRRRRQRAKPHELVPLRVRLHRYTGYFLALAFVGHVAATRGPSLVFGLETDFAFLHLSLATAPYFFFPYYALLAFSGGYHLVHGALVALDVLGVKLPGAPRSPRSRPFWVFAAVWAAAALTIVLAFGGVLAHVEDARLEPWRALFAELLG